MTTLAPLPPIAGSAPFRKQMGTALQKQLGKAWIVFPDIAPVNAITKPTLRLQRLSVARTPAAPAGLRRSVYQLDAISNQVIAESREDYLDGLVDDVLAALDDLGIIWTACDRGIYNGTNPVYSITINASNARS
jgi:hypothetical protein